MINHIITWNKGDELNKWVRCLNCDYEYYIESSELNPSCPLCDSTSYEEDNEFEEEW